MVVGCGEDGRTRRVASPKSRGQSPSEEVTMWLAAETFHSRTKAVRIAREKELLDIGWLEDMDRAGVG